MENNALKTLLPLYLLVLALILSSCKSQPTAPPIDINPTTPATLLPTATFTPEPAPPRVLTICLGQEPDSLFVYGDSSLAARSVREAIYDGPYDLLGFEVSPVILEEKPTLANGGATLESVQVQPSDQVVDARGNIVNLGEGIDFIPFGCSEAECAQTFSGDEPVTMDQLSVRFTLRSGVLWSDGQPLRASDSVYSYEVAGELFPGVRPDLVRYTSSYQALDESTVEWRALPGYRDATYTTNFFTPLPEHLWVEIPPDGLMTAELSTRTPMGWGPYVIDEWVAGDHISLKKNSNYFRADERLPRFDFLVYRFVSNTEEALEALEVGECDLIDETALIEAQLSDLTAMEDSGLLALEYETGTAWEHVDFGISPSNPDQLSFFQIKEVRQAIAMCIDRVAIADQLYGGGSQVPDTYVHPLHPLYAVGVEQYGFDPQAASMLLASAGWEDVDGDPETPRLAQGVSGILDGTPLEFTYQTLIGDQREQVAQAIQASLKLCGVKLNLDFVEWDALFAPGPDGSIFGRKFDMAQFAWTNSLKPPCFLYSSEEIPGPYPDFAKGWGGANATGYSNPEFDLACEQARNSLPDQPEHAEAHRRAQEIFADDLPAIPLYLHLKYAAARPDLCGLILDPSASSAVWNLEEFDYGSACE
jgi:peptide/nickel transport system substrate-binding protein